MNSKTKPISKTRISEKDPLFLTIIDAIQAKKANNLIALDLRKIDEAVADFFIICDVQTGIQLAAIAENVEKEVREKTGERPYHMEAGPTWTLIDYINVVVHLFTQDERKFYDLEGLWADAVKSTYEDTPRNTTDTTNNTTNKTVKKK